MENPKPQANNPERPPALADATGYAAGDRVEVINKTIWGCQTGTVHWCNSQWMNVRLDNNKAILSLHVTDVKPHNGALTRAGEERKPNYAEEKL